MPRDVNALVDLVVWLLTRRLHRKLDELEARVVDMRADMFWRDERTRRVRVDREYN